MGDTEQRTVVMLRTTLVEPNRDQPRKQFDENALNTLTESIEKYGIVQPIAVEKADGYYRIIAGERRWRAAMRLHLKEIPVIVLNISEQEAADIALIENLQREDLNPIEEAMAYRDYCEKYNVTHEELAERLSTSRVNVTNAMRLLGLSPEVQDMVRDGTLSPGHGRTLLAIRDPKRQYEIAKQIAKDGINVRGTEKLVRQEKRKKQKSASANNRTYDPEWLGRELTNRTGWKINVSAGKKGGTVQIEFYDDETLDEIYEYLISRRNID